MTAQQPGCRHPEGQLTSNEDWIMCFECGARWPNRVGADALDVEVLTEAMQRLDTGPDGLDYSHTYAVDSAAEFANAIAAEYRVILAEREPKYSEFSISTRDLAKPKRKRTDYSVVNYDEGDEAPD